eukprot:NODE_2132_length_2286_cov_5.852246.p1 GENE.NODE_2132_length_2286_cov_5.852246~~NODE_2132_length_2286_cov_5.852246.p1  ORF type:complete len:554 (-),score=112.62 NODE_2132_length_2286_cov_5.852246:260-1921(-)
MALRMIQKNENLCSLDLPAALRCGSSHLSHAWARLETEVLPRFEENGWKLHDAMVAMRNGERNLPTLVRWRDAHETAVIEHVHGVVTQLEKAGVYFNVMPSTQRSVAALDDVFRSIAEDIVEGPGSVHWPHVESEVLPALEEQGWTLRDAVRLMKEGHRDIRTITDQVDPNSASVLEHLFELVNQKLANWQMPSQPTASPSPGGSRALDAGEGVPAVSDGGAGVLHGSKSSSHSGVQGVDVGSGAPAQLDPAPPPESQASLSMASQGACLPHEPMPAVVMDTLSSQATVDPESVRTAVEQSARRLSYEFPRMGVPRRDSNAIPRAPPPPPPPYAQGMRVVGGSLQCPVHVRYGATSPLPGNRGGSMRVPVAMVPGIRCPGPGVPLVMSTSSPPGSMQLPPMHPAMTVPHPMLGVSRNITPMPDPAATLRVAVPQRAHSPMGTAPRVSPKASPRCPPAPSPHRSPAVSVSPPASPRDRRHHTPLPPPPPGAAIAWGPVAPARLGTDQGKLMSTASTKAQALAPVAPSAAVPAADPVPPPLGVSKLPNAVFAWQI